MKHPLFASLGDEYPHSLEQQFDRILIKIEQLWDTPEIDDYFSDLIIDKRGGRKGFPQEVLNDIVRLRSFRESETLGQAERIEYAIYQLRERGYGLSNADFFKALEMGSQELIDLYVRSNFNIHIHDEWGATPMLAALKRGHTVTAGILLNAGSDVNARDRLGLAPILVACGKPSIGFRTITESLIRKGADINVRDPLGNTPLILAISGGMFDIAEMLLERGAEVAPTNRKGHSALSLMHQPGVAKGHPLIALLLEKSQAARAKGGG
jgi:uncharacterized protein